MRLLTLEKGLYHQFVLCLMVGNPPRFAVFLATATKPTASPSYHLTSRSKLSQNDMKRLQRHAHLALELIKSFFNTPKI